MRIFAFSDYPHQHATDLKFCMIVPWGNRFEMTEAIFGELPLS